MATVVYQGFQSYFESQHFEPRALRLRLSSPNNPHLLSTPLKSHFITPQDNISNVHVASLSSSDSNSNSNSSSESWSFLDPSSNDDKEKKKKKTLLLPYVQPPSSRRTLSDESLALCTESLGSETGSDIICEEDEDLFAVSSTMEARTTSSSSRQSRKRNVIMASLPPPLTSMRGFECIQVKSRRENGRLVMTATNAPTRNRCLQDRSNGCVRLAILIDSKEDEVETIETERDNEEEEEIQENEEEEEEEIEVKRIQRSRRCVEEGERENRGFLNWESLCVATS